MRYDRKTVQDMYVRVCRDSGYSMDYVKAANFAASVIGGHPMDIWIAMPSLDAMIEIAAGTHPACKLKGDRGASENASGDAGDC